MSWRALGKFHFRELSLVLWAASHASTATSTKGQKQIKAHCKCRVRVRYSPRIEQVDAVSIVLRERIYQLYKAYADGRFEALLDEAIDDEIEFFSYAPLQVFP